MRTKRLAWLLLALVSLAACRSETSSPAPAPTNPPEPASPPPPAETSVPQPEQGVWLDKPLQSWMAGGAEIPRPPQMQVDDATKERCKGQNRPAASPEDRLLEAAGWSLFGPLQTFGASTLISAMATVDASCRPRFMQTFVFKEGAFAGTVSPEPMESRTDGAQRYAFLTSADYVVAEFARYRPDDARCCPSRFATVVYQIKTEEPGKPVLFPIELKHEEAPKREQAPTPGK